MCWVKLVLCKVFVGVVWCVGVVVWWCGGVTKGDVFSNIIFMLVQRDIYIDREREKEIISLNH